jgi:hypothetical protein
MPDAGSALQPAEVTNLTCPRCWFSAASFIPYGALTFRCARCEWPFTLGAPVLSAAPTFPLTTVVVTNPYATPVAATITLNGATITGFYVNGVSAGTTAGVYIIPVGGTFSATFTGGPPTWAWALPAISAGVSAGGTALTFAPTGTNAAFAVGQVLIVDPAGTSDVVTVSGTPTATSVPVSSLNSAHLTAVLVAVAALTPALSGTGLENVPKTAY